ncbi:MAG TPA: DUF1990 family protein [Polyangia bacterium]
MAETPSSQTSELQEGLLTACDGCGPLLQRDYWAVIDGCTLSPPVLIQTVAERFMELPPEDLVTFTREPGAQGPLVLGEEIMVRIRMAGACRVRLVHRNEQSLTLATLPGHPEAGRITFGAYRNDAGDVIFHIRSRARSSTHANYVGFLTAGDPMQTATWTDFVASVANSFGNGVVGRVYAETETKDEGALVNEDACSPTFLAVGG